MTAPAPQPRPFKQPAKPDETYKRIKPILTTRKCLACAKGFPSYGVANRICLKCKDSKGYRN